MHAFDLAALAADRAASGGRYFEFLRVAHLSAGLYVLRAGEPDPQRPHAEDEVYHVVKGLATFAAGGTRRPVGPGSLLYVPAREDHRFEDVTEDLVVLVFFAPAESARPAARAEAPVADVRVERVTSRSLDEVLPLVADYQRFYGATPDAGRNRFHFGRLVKDPEAGVQFLARSDAGVVGFATMYFPYSSVQARRYAQLNDLFTVATARRSGVGRALMDAARAEAKARGFAKLTLQTAEDNATAQRLYDGVGATSTRWRTYDLDVG